MRRGREVLVRGGIITVPRRHWRKLRRRARQRGITPEQLIRESWILSRIKPRAGGESNT